MNKAILIVGASVLSAAAGVAGGYFYAKKELEQKYSELAANEIADAKKFYSMLHKKEEFATPEAVVEKLIPQARFDEHVSDETLQRVVDGLKKPEAMPERTKSERTAAEAVRIYQGVAKGIRGEEEPPRKKINSNIFEETREDMKLQPDFHGGRSHIYIITQEQYMHDEVGYRQQSLTWFAGDEVLANEEDVAVDLEEYIGKDNLQFGVASKDPNYVYVRNENLQLDFEVSRDAGEYRVIVQGFDDPNETEPED